MLAGTVMFTTAEDPSAVDPEVSSPFVIPTVDVGETLDSCVKGNALFVETTTSVRETVVGCPAIVVGSSSKVLVSSINCAVSSSDFAVRVSVD